MLAELEFAFKREPEVSRLLDLVAKGEISERVTHNDTKLNNAMLDDKTGEGICVIDLDTVMPGLSLYDFGDLVRFGTKTAAEDETDPAKIDVSLPVFEAIVEGYVAGAGNILTDHLQCDIYFKIKHPGHNLERVRNQLRLVDRIEAADEALRAIVRKYRAAR